MSNVDMKDEKNSLHRWSISPGTIAPRSRISDSNFAKSSGSEDFSFDHENIYTGKNDGSVLHTQTTKMTGSCLDNATSLKSKNSILKILQAVIAAKQETIKKIQFRQKQNHDLDLPEEDKSIDLLFASSERNVSSA